LPDTRSAKVTITNKYGLHARPATDFAMLAERYACEVLVRVGDVDADGKSIMELMMLAATKGTEIEVTCTGDDAEHCLKELSELVARGFDEEDE
jgi:phosphocarrier protein|tara:strand:+ start:15323 stop:15604 length:282 start_codon:yes stop_codon:yes gene_type:complete